MLLIKPFLPYARRSSISRGFSAVVGLVLNG